MLDLAACQVQVAVGDHEAALSLARSTVDARLAACAQVSGPMRSIYRWQGAIEEADEWMVLFKTRLSLYPVLEHYLNEHHSYEVPEIICIPLAAANPAYLSWIFAVTTDDH